MYFQLGNCTVVVEVPTVLVFMVEITSAVAAAVAITKEALMDIKLV